MKNSYNMKNSGLGGDTISNNPNREEIIKNISETLKNRIFTEEHRKKLSESAKNRKGNKPCKFKGLKYEDYLSEEKTKESKEKISKAFKGKSYKDRYGEEKSNLIREKISLSQKGTLIGPMSEEHKENLKKSFKNRDIERKRNTINKNINFLDSFLNEGITEDNYNYAKRIYQKVLRYNINMDRYSPLLTSFKKIEFIRRSKRKKIDL